MDLSNLADRVIQPTLQESGLKWHGWHAYRRGLATNLKELGIDDLVIQRILRHGDVGTTQKSYIKVRNVKVEDAMRQLAPKPLRHEQPLFVQLPERPKLVN
jgi:site-specific recombinase XerD